MPNKRIAYKPIPPDILSLVEKHAQNPESIVEILRDVQNAQGELIPGMIGEVARGMHIPAGRAFGVATFYSMLVTPRRTIRICDSPACWLRGAAYARAALNLEGAPWKIERTSCLGLCDRAPAALVSDEQCGPLTLENISGLPSGWRGEMPNYSRPLPGETRVLLAHAGEIDPDDINSALSFGAYQALKMALMSPPEKVFTEVETSGLRGRGGAGFPTGRKLRFVAQNASFPKYIVCNADESEPLVFKDRVMIDTNPHKVIEGMTLAAYAVGAQEGFIYIRGEYQRQADRLVKAIQQAESHHLLGSKIQNSEFSFHIHVHRGAGAYICGEETALLESLEGRRGEPRIRPPFPASYGYRGQPTVVNNVETFASIPGIIANGAEWYRSFGPPDTPGTKLYIVLGHVNRPGLFEAPYGLTLRQIISDYGGGMPAGSDFHFALTGGAAGTIVPASLMNVPINYSSVTEGVSLGAGAFLICDQTVSPVMMLREIMFFFEMESCGKCTPCRVGTQRARQLLDGIIAGSSDGRRVEELSQLADLLQNTSFCGLGQSAAMPIKSTIKHFNEELMS